MAARMRAMILIPFFIISFSSPIKDGEKRSVVAPDQSCSEHRGAACSENGALTSRDAWGSHAIVPQMQQFFSIANELDWIKYICTKSKINIALLNSTKRL